MKFVKYILMIITIVIIAACGELISEAEDENTGELINLVIEIPQDTLFITQDVTAGLLLKGFYVESNDIYYWHEGATFTKSFITIDEDSTNEVIDRTVAEWYSTVQSVATVNEGTVEAVSDGVTEIYARYKGIESNHIMVRVNGYSMPPGINVDMEKYKVIFENELLVEGNVQTYQNMANPTLTYSINNSTKRMLTVAATGVFSNMLNGMFVSGENTLQFHCTHPLDSNLVNTVNYYVRLADNSSEMQNVYGNYKGDKDMTEVMAEVSEGDATKYPDVTTSLAFDTGLFGPLTFATNTSTFNKNGECVINLENTNGTAGFILEGNMTLMYRTANEIKVDIYAKISNSNLPGLGDVKVIADFMIQKL